MKLPQYPPFPLVECPMPQKISLMYHFHKCFFPNHQASEIHRHLKLRVKMKADFFSNGLLVLFTSCVVMNIMYMFQISWLRQTEVKERQLMNGRTG